MYVEQWGTTGAKVVLVHGGGAGGAANFLHQKPLADRWTLLFPDRPGHGKTPANGRDDFEKDAPLIADLLGEGSHLVGHSYGGLGALLAAALRPEAVLSLTLIEPAAFRIAQGNPDADEFTQSLIDLFQNPPEPEVFMLRFLELTGVPFRPPSPMPPPMIASVQEILKMHVPWEADVPVEKLANSSFRKLVITGGHSKAFDAIADALVAQIGGQRAVIPGMGHSVQDIGEPFNKVVEQFWLDQTEAR
ncbi:MAG: alpha/beta hydrolase [Chloroflexota bacterium]